MYRQPLRTMSEGQMAILQRRDRYVRNKGKHRPDVREPATRCSFCDAVFDETNPRAAQYRETAACRACEPELFRWLQTERPELCAHA